MLFRCCADTKATLEVSETVFSMLAAVNVCGYDQGLASSLPGAGRSSG